MESLFSPKKMTISIRFVITVIIFLMSFSSSAIDDDSDGIDDDWELVNDKGVSETTYRMDGLELSNKGESGQTVTYRYDRAARLVEIIDGVGNQSLIDYEFGDEVAGRRVWTLTNPNSKVFYLYDELNRPIQYNKLSVKDDGLVIQTKFEYNERGNSSVVIDW